MNELQAIEKRHVAGKAAWLHHVNGMSTERLNVMLHHGGAAISDRDTLLKMVRVLLNDLHAVLVAYDDGRLTPNFAAGTPSDFTPDDLIEGIRELVGELWTD